MLRICLMEQSNLYVDNIMQHRLKTTKCKIINPPEKKDLFMKIDPVLFLKMAHLFTQRMMT